MKTDVLCSSEREDWTTPQAFFDALDAEFGFDLDAAASHKNHKCDRYYTKDDDALLQEWTGTVFCNPPYCRKTSLFVKKAYEEHQKHGNVIVMLLPARTGAKWFHEYVYSKAEIRFVRGRLKFGGSKNNAPFDSMVCIYK